MLRMFVWCLCACIGISSGLAASNTAPINGYVQLCKEKPALNVCLADKAVTRAVPPRPLSRRDRALIEEVNLKWNTQITEITDQDKYQVGELWNADTDSGDCEEFQLAKKDSLLALGFDASQLLLAVVQNTNGGHLVLFVLTSEGTLVLDNLNNKIVLLEEMSYPLIKHQSPDDPDSIWVAY